MNRAIGALGQRFAQHLLGTRGTAGNHHDFALVLFALAERLFQRKSIGFVHFVGDVFANPRAAFVELERCIFLRHLLHADQDFQTSLLLPMTLGVTRETH